MLEILKVYTTNKKIRELMGVSKNEECKAIALLDENGKAYVPEPNTDLAVFQNCQTIHDCEKRTIYHGIVLPLKEILETTEEYDLLYDNGDFQYSVEVECYPKTINRLFEDAKYCDTKHWSKLSVDDFGNMIGVPKDIVRTWMHEENPPTYLVNLIEHYLITEGLTHRKFEIAFTTEDYTDYDGIIKKSTDYEPVYADSIAEAIELMLEFYNECRLDNSNLTLMLDEEMDNYKKMEHCQYYADGCHNGNIVKIDSVYRRTEDGFEFYDIAEDEDSPEKQLLVMTGKWYVSEIKEIVLTTEE
jgi:hypothetical protein